MGLTASPDTVNTARPTLPVPQHELTVMATIAHELRGPLTALATSSELLAEDFLHLDPEQVKTMLGAMHRRTLWLQGLVENLLCAATIREGRLQLYRQSLSLVDLLEDVDAVVGPLLAQRGQRLRVRFAHGVPEVIGDSRRLSQVLVNLIWVIEARVSLLNTCIGSSSRTTATPPARAAAKMGWVSACPSSSPSSRPTVAWWASSTAAAVALDSGSPFHLLDARRPRNPI